MACNHKDKMEVSTGEFLSKDKKKSEKNTILRIYLCFDCGATRTDWKDKNGYSRGQWSKPA